MDRSAKAKEILSKISYITVATASKAGDPWNSPVFAAFDEQYNFYWVSWHGTQHSKNIKENPNVFIVIYDSTVPHGEGEGVYLKAKAAEISDLSEVERALLYVYRRKGKSPRKSEEFSGEHPRRIYKAVPEQFWINLGVDVKDQVVDTRQEITL